MTPPERRGGRFAVVVFAAIFLLAVAATLATLATLYS